MPRAWASCGRSRCSTSRAERLQQVAAVAGAGQLQLGQLTDHERAGERLRVAHGACRLLGLPGPGEGVAVVLLAEPDQRREGGQPGPHARRLGALVVQHQPLGDAELAESRRERARPLPGARPLQEQLGAGQRIVAQQGGRPAVGVEGRVEHPGQLPHIAEQRQDPHPLTRPGAPGAGGPRRAPARRARRHRGWRTRPGPDRRRGVRSATSVRRHHPREVQREGVRGGVAVGPFDRHPGGQVQPAADPVRQPVVGGVPDETVAEPQSVGPVPVDERRRRDQAGRVDGDALGGQHLDEGVDAEGAAEDRRVAQEPAGRGVEGVDLCGHRTLERIRHRIRRVEVVRRAGQLLHEQRVAVGAGDDGVDLVRSQRGRLGGVGEERAQRRFVQRREGDGRPVVRREPAFGVAARHQQQPRPALGRGRQPLEQVRRRGVGPLRVVHEDQQRPADRGAEHGAHHLGHHVRAEPRIDGLALRGRRHVEVHHVAEEREQRDERGVEDGHPLGEARHRVGAVPPADLEQRTRIGSRKTP